MTKYGKNFKHYREKNGLSQDDLAKKLNISRQAISKWENDWNVPDISNLEELCKLYNITMDELLNADIEQEHRSEQSEEISSMHIGTALEKCRKDCGLTQEEAADKLGVTRQEFSNWEKGHSIPDLKMAKKISKLYNVKLEKLLGEEEIKSTEEVYSERKLLLYVVFSSMLCISCMFPVFGILMCLFTYYLAYRYHIHKSFIIIAFTIIALIVSLWNTWGFINVTFLKQGTATIEVVAALHRFYL